jgi:DNA-binding transcriptional LysR family regulator
MEPPDRISRRLKLRGLHIFDTVVQCGSMAKAASLLHVTQPAVSKAIDELERVIGLRLLDRNPQGVEATVYGRALLKRGTAIFDELQQGVKEIQFLADPTAGEVRIGCGEAFGAGVLPAILERLGRQYPRVVYHVVLTTSPEEELRVLRERRIDLLLTRVEEPFLEDDMDADVLFHERLCVVAGEKNKWARRRRIELAELLDERWILTPPNSMPFALVEEAFRAKGLAVPVARAVSFSVHLRNSLLPTGRYLTVLPLSCLRYSPMRSALRALPVDFQSRPTPVAVVTLRHRTPNPVAQIVVECAREVVQPLRETKST